jgi:hypothetical protein
MHPREKKGVTTNRKKKKERKHAIQHDNVQCIRHHLNSESLLQALDVSIRHSTEHSLPPLHEVSFGKLRSHSHCAHFGGLNNIKITNT